ncbi:MAG TPA: histidine kinase dimerization/phospho-acceptor domain-containing protein, partial [Gemmatimonadaceae bacterium]|nr:histidine kinase dimerization/phospho-acceptor domain-containing protein [Gemmatimonadaceae bacterium]
MTESTFGATLGRPSSWQRAIMAAGPREPVIFAARPVLRGVYMGRLAIALSVFVAVVLGGWHSDARGPLVVSLALVGAFGFTAASVIWTDVAERAPGRTFRYLQVVVDMLLVTAAVHATWSGGHSQLAPLYILVIAVSALLVTTAGVPLVASFGMVLYFADAMLAHGREADPGLLIQLIVFTAVAITSGIIAARLRAAGSASEQLAAELAAFRLRETDIRRLQVRAERLEGIAEMSASLAHEIKNPLASIRSAVEQLSRMPRASEDEKILSGLVQRESDRLARVLSEFLDFSRAGVTHVEPLDLAAIARNAARLAASQPGIAPGVKIVERITPGPMVIRGDEDLIHRAIYNLLLNAVQASPPGGEVRLEGGELQRHQLPAAGEDLA